MTDELAGKTLDAICSELSCTVDGLSSAKAAERLKTYGRNTLAQRKRSNKLQLFLHQFASPIVLLLIGAAFLSFGLGDRIDAIIIMAIVIASAALSFHQEASAGDAVQQLLKLIATMETVRRDGKDVPIPIEEIVPGDVVEISAGTLIPGDGLIIESTGLMVNEAALTGESFPVEKSLEGDRCLFSGTHSISGEGRMIVARSGRNTHFGQIAARLSLRPPENEFERGLRQFGYLLAELTLLLTLGVFAVNLYLGRPWLESFMFALALAVGLTPQLLPAILSVNLARGAKEMAKAKVIVKKLESIENFGSMDVLCSDKTGTLTEGTIIVRATDDADGKASERVLLLSRLNAHFQTGYTNPIDDAVLSGAPDDAWFGYTRIGEIPYDFDRKRLSVLIQGPRELVLVTKGAAEPAIECCGAVRLADGSTTPMAGMKMKVLAQVKAYGENGYRALGVASKTLANAPVKLGAADESDLVFEGFLVLEDPLRKDCVEVVQRLNGLGISLKLITGDNRHVAGTIGGRVGLRTERVLTGADMNAISDEALRALVRKCDVFAEIAPNQKERLILACKKAGYVVGYIGDGINDSAALHAADVGVSVANGSDVAKEAADLVLLEPGLDVLNKGVEEGRRTVANTLKYVFMASSANFGNMFSMAGASFLLTFLPLLPKQVLFLNMLTDLPEMTIAGDAVDPELVERPLRWSVRFIRRFMLVFGPLSSLFDFATFGAFIWLKSSPETLRTGWFLESLISATLIVLVLRTRRPFFKSMPSRALGISTCAVIVAALAFPFTPLGRLFGFVAPTPLVLGVVFAIVAAYVISAEITKHLFYKLVRKMN